VNTNAVITFWNIIGDWEKKKQKGNARRVKKTSRGEKEIIPWGWEKAWQSLLQSGQRGVEIEGIPFWSNRSQQRKANPLFTEGRHLHMVCIIRKRRK